MKPLIELPIVTQKEEHAPDPLLIPQLTEPDINNVLLDNRTITYSEYLSESIERNITYSEYLSESIERNIINEKIEKYNKVINSFRYSEIYAKEEDINLEYFKSDISDSEHLFINISDISDNNFIDNSHYNFIHSIVFEFYNPLVDISGTTDIGENIINELKTICNGLHSVNPILYPVFTVYSFKNSQFLRIDILYRNNSLEVSEKISEYLKYIRDFKK